MSEQLIQPNENDDGVERNITIHGEQRVVELTQRRPLDIHPQVFEVPFTVWKRIAAIIITGDADMEDAVLEAEEATDG